MLQITKRHRSEQHVVLRARIVLAAAQGHPNVQIADALGISVDTARLWRDRWAGLQGRDLETLSLAERLQDAPRPGARPKFTSEQRCQMAALACEAPATAGRPISQWTGREIADELKKQSIVEQISPRHAARLLKKGGVLFYYISAIRFRAPSNEWRSCLKRPQVSSDVRGKRHASGSGTARGVKPADNA